MSTILAGVAALSLRFAGCSDLACNPVAKLPSLPCVFHRSERSPDAGPCHLKRVEIM